MLQKIVYLLGRVRGEDLGFEAYLYGPYSRDLQATLEDLTVAGLIEESRLELAPWEPSPFDVVQYRYRLTPLGTSVIGDVPADLKADADRVRKAAAHHGAWSSPALAVAAKLDHIRQIRPDVKLDDVPDAAREFGWRVSDSDVLRAHHLLEGLGLAPA